ncbi:heavy metal-associated isoprenylated plant protein 47-like [Neltuma alba]|uniref:heavy metal-associated isoprenylated plant protein 47-like n=1 Tax=Neltuma alba TaxID=207710 RepID=UPI0010A4FB18|nr:heavy metal-associated isoprenylated plant protein 47-like [Prosopis alba]
MKQKIVIEVPLKCEKCRTKAMSIASVAMGVTSVTFDRKERDKVVIIGEGVDATLLTKSLRKKFSYAHLVGVSKLEAS